MKDVIIFAGAGLFHPLEWIVITSAVENFVHMLTECTMNF